MVCFNKLIENLNDDIQQVNILCSYIMKGDFESIERLEINFNQILFINDKIKKCYKGYLDDVFNELNDSLKGKSIDEKRIILMDYWKLLRHFDRDTMTSESSINKNIIAFESKYDVVLENGFKFFNAGTRNEIQLRQQIDTYCFNKLAVNIKEALVGLDIYLKKLSNGFETIGKGSIKIDESRAKSHHKANLKPTFESRLNEKQIQELSSLINSHKIFKKGITPTELKNLFDLTLNEPIQINNTIQLSWLFNCLKNADLITENWQNTIHQAKCFKGKRGSILSNKSLSNSLNRANPKGTAEKSIDKGIESIKNR